MKLTDFTSPKEFQDFCDTLFHAVFASFQSFDDSGGDLGMDGYVPDKKIFAIYFPDRDKLTKKNYKAKIKSDLTTISKTIEERKLKAKDWIFVTPLDLPTDVVLFLREEVSKYKLEGTSYGARKLTQLLSENPKIMSQYPNLAVPDIKEDTQKIKTIVSETDKNVVAIMKKLGIENEGKQKPIISSIDVLDDENIKKSFEHWQKAEMKEAYKYAETAYHNARGHVKLQAIINMILSTDQQVQKTGYFIALCKEGIELANQLGDLSSSAILKGHKAYLIHHKMFEASMALYAETRYRQIGYGLMGSDEIQRLSETVKQSSREADVLVREAQEEAIKAKNWDALAHVKVTIGNAAGLSYFLTKEMGLDTGEIEHYSTKNLLEAKDLYEQLGDKEGVSNSLHNLANNLRFFGDLERSKEYSKQAWDIAKEIGYKELEVKAKELFEDRLGGK
ncbi:MAG: hypothetical protein AAB546_00595 [Patescibacteria group bacterium]